MRDPNLDRITQSRLAAKRAHAAALKGVEQKRAELAKAEAIEREAREYSNSTEIALRMASKTRAPSRSD